MQKTYPYALDSSMPWILILVLIALAGCQSDSGSTPQPSNTPSTSPVPSAEPIPSVTSTAQPSASPHPTPSHPDLSSLSGFNHCQQCHLTQDNGFAFRGQRRFADASALSSYIEFNMPGYNPALCGHDCAQSISQVLWQHWQTRLEQPSSSLAHWQLLTPEMTLEKASIRLAGQLPSAQQRRQASRGETELAQVLRELMQGPAFDDFLMTAANDLLLTRKWLNDDSGGINSLSSEYHTHGLDDYLAREQQVQQARQAFESQCGNGCSDADSRPDDIELLYQHWQQQQLEFYLYRQALTRAVADQPLQLLRHLVANERPYSEWLTADYVMLNPLSAQWAHDLQLSFNDPTDLNEFQPGQIRHYRQVVHWLHEGQPGSAVTNYPEAIPQAGVLTTMPFLARYFSTDTNRNRMRASAVYRLFLGLDIESLATRPMDQEVLNDQNNPTLNNPACAQCHQIMDPVAASFMSWGNDGIYRERNGQDSLPWTYVWPAEGERLYQEGDHWYRDMRRAGFFSEGLMNYLPSQGDFGPAQQGDAVQWLARQVVADPRFLQQGVRYWYQALFGLSMTEMHGHSPAGQARMLEVEQQLLDVFSKEQNLKDLFVAMLLLPEFRAQQALNTEAEQIPLIGPGRLLTPEELSRKLKALSGWRWNYPWRPEHDRLLTDYYLLYGGIDSDNIVQRNQQLDPIMFNLLQRMGNELSCPMVLHEFDGRSSRLLFAGFDPMVLPSNAQGQAAIRQQLMQLVRLLWQRQWPADHPEVEALYQLYLELWQERQAIQQQAPDGWGRFISYSQLWDDKNQDPQWDEFCDTRVDYLWDDVDWQNPRATLGFYYNPEHSVRLWSAIVSLMLADPYFIFD